MSEATRRAGPFTGSKHATGQVDLISRRMIREETSRHRRKHGATIEPSRLSATHEAT